MTSSNILDEKVLAARFSVNEEIVNYAIKNNIDVRIISGGDREKCYNISGKDFRKFVEDNKSLEYKKGILQQ